MAVQPGSVVAITLTLTEILAVHSGCSSRQCIQAMHPGGAVAITLTTGEAQIR